MGYTTHGLMTAADLTDYRDLYDTGAHPDCPGHADEQGLLVRCSVNEDCPGEDEA